MSFFLYHSIPSFLMILFGASPSPTAPRVSPLISGTVTISLAHRYPCCYPYIWYHDGVTLWKPAITMSWDHSSVAKMEPKLAASCCLKSHHGAIGTPQTTFSASCSSLSQRIEDTYRWQHFYSEFQNYKKEQAALIENVKCGFDMRLMFLESSLATTAELLNCLLSSGAMLSSECKANASVDTKRNANIAASLSRSLSQLWRDEIGHVEPCTSRIVECSPPPMQDDSALTRCDESFQHLSDILADMSHHWSLHKSCDSPFETRLLQKVEAMSADFHKIGQSEGEACSMKHQSQSGSTKTSQASRPTTQFDTYLADERGCISTATLDQPFLHSVQQFG